jgi:hypothetical protein
VFPDNIYKDIFWLVPISSQLEKYKALYGDKIQKYGRCNTIRFGNMLGKELAFLIQNMCPVTEKYILNIYLDRIGNPIQAEDRTIQDVIANARAVLAL